MGAENTRCSCVSAHIYTLRTDQGRSPDEFSVYNVMLPRTYYPRWQGNLYERRCRAIANQLQGGDMDVDFDQVSTKLLLKQHTTVALVTSFSHQAHSLAAKRSDLQLSMWRLCTCQVSVSSHCH